MSDKIIVAKRNGEVVDYDVIRVRNAIVKAVVASGKQVDNDVIDGIVDNITNEIANRFSDLIPNVENVQDVVEKNLMANNLYEAAKHYILYRAEKQKQREKDRKKTSFLRKMTVKKRDGRTMLFNIKKIDATITRLSEGLNFVSKECIMDEFLKNIYDGVSTDEIVHALILSATSIIEKDPEYSHFGARLFSQKIYKEIFKESISDKDVFDTMYRDSFVANLKKGVEYGLLDPRLLEFDLEAISKMLVPERDDLFRYIGIQTLYERYFLKYHDTHLETPQAFWMRAAMGLAVNENNKEDWAGKFYNVISTLRGVPSTPTLFHSGLTHPQCSSCYLTYVGDDLHHIFKCIGDNAQLSKWSGGLGNDWSSVRGTGAWISSTNVESQGVIPFLKVANDTTSAINRSGKRRGACCAYLETTHLDIEDFLDLRKNTGDERRRTHDMNTANWIPDLFMKRVIEDGKWTLFSPDEVKDLHDIYGKAFEERYTYYEGLAEKQQIKKYKVVEAKKLWRKMLSMLFETGHPWLTWKDAGNIRSPQGHVGVVHSSNLCTEIFLNTSKDEVAVCNLQSVNLSNHVVDGKIDWDTLAETVSIQMRMLDNVIDYNFYPIEEARNSNMRHRPVGHGSMGWADMFFKLNIDFSSPEAIVLCDEVQEFISYHIIKSSSLLAKERGTYSTYKGSNWDKGILPIDTLKMLEDERGVPTGLNIGGRMDWNPIRSHIKDYGMRNSLCMAIAPTATISNIAGCYPCIEPIYKNIYVKSNMSGEFTIINSYLVEDLKKINMWDKEMIEKIKYHNGNISDIAEIPQPLKEKYKEAFDIDPIHCINMTAARGKWIDQSQSHNVFMKGLSGSKLHEVYMHAWKCGLKSTYYLRSTGASQIEKSTVNVKKMEQLATEEASVQFCRLDDPTCESCQ